jgi:hypothetical protein
MGLDLRLLPCENWIERDGQKLCGYSHTILELGRVCEDAWNAFQETVKPHLVELPAGHDVSAYTGALVTEGYHKGVKIYGTFRSKDPYGEPFTVVTAQHLLPWIEEHFRYDGRRGYGPYQAAIAAYIRALPPETKIVLDWH